MILDVNLYILDWFGVYCEFATEYQQIPWEMEIKHLMKRSTFIYTSKNKICAYSRIITMLFLQMVWIFRLPQFTHE